MQDGRVILEKDIMMTDKRIKPPASIYDFDKNILLVIEMPGIIEETMSLTLDDRLLEIQADKVVVQGNNKLIDEINQFGYYRYFNLGENIDDENIHAKYENGVLSISLDKKEVTVYKEIKIH